MGEIGLQCISNRNVLFSCSDLRPGLLRDFRVGVPVGWRGFSGLASDWLAVQPPAGQRSCCGTRAGLMDFDMGFLSNLGPWCHFRIILKHLCYVYQLQLLSFGYHDYMGR